MKNILVLVLLVLTVRLFAQIPPGYYDNALGKDSIYLQQALHDIIKNHNAVGYGNVPTHHQSTDKKPNGKVWDMYSDVPGGTPPYQFTFMTDKCGNYSTEGDCYNREHSFPQSWFNSQEPMQSDLFHVYPTDGYVNGRRSNNPFAEVDNPTWTSLNGSKLGPSVSAGYSGTGFEPIDEYKGDFARTYFYMAVRYYSEDNSWASNAMVTGSQLKPWALNQLYQWHLQDTVSQKEIDRNNAVYQIQGNRNPFIDRPDWVDSLWFPSHGSSSHISKISTPVWQIFPNPANNKVNISFESKTTSAKLTLLDLSGRELLSRNIQSHQSALVIDLSPYKSGVYFLRYSNAEFQIVKKLIIQN